MQLSEQVKTALNYIQTIDVSHIEDPIAAGRAFYEEFIPMAGAEEPLYKIENMEVFTAAQSINVRLYRPSGDAELPVLLYFHGGWFNSGSLATHDRPLRKLARLSGALIIAVDYRLAPEFPFPAGINDGHEVLNWAIANAKTLGIDLNRVGIAGDSAGAALATSLTQRVVKNKLHPLRCQVLIYPVTDAALETPSWQEFKDGPVLNYEGGIQAWNLYLTTKDEAKNPEASPLQERALSEMPATFMLLAEYDALRDEGMLYATQLKKSGVELELSLYKGMIHGFFQMGGIIAEGNLAIEETANYLIQKFK